MGFIRIAMQAYKIDWKIAQKLVDEMRKESGGFIERNPPPKVPGWIKSPGDTTDSYLCQLAKENGMLLATFDRKIPTSEAVFYIP